MSQSKSAANVFVVDTPYQLLNAVEAVHFFELKNNHLFVIRHENGGQDRFQPLLRARDWAAVTILTATINSKLWGLNILGPLVSRWYSRYLHFQRMHGLAKVTSRFKHVDKVFIGHYWAEAKPYMRHIANTINHNALYLLDDGTDTIDINDRRKEIKRHNGSVHAEPNNTSAPVFQGLHNYLRNKYWNWNVAEPPKVTFFTIFELDVQRSDRLIKHSYSYLRSLGPTRPSYSPDTVIFLGQCMVEDGCMEQSTYFAFLSKVRQYFAGKQFIYVAHPREDALSVTRITQYLRCELWAASSVIEYDLVVRGFKPGAVAGFVSSALITLAEVLDPEVEILCFRIAPMHWMNWRDYAIGVYDYLEKTAKPRVTLVALNT